MDVVTVWMVLKAKRLDNIPEEVNAARDKQKSKEGALTHSNFKRWRDQEKSATATERYLSVCWSKTSRKWCTELQVKNRISSRLYSS